MKVSFAITCRDEVKEVNELLSKLYRFLAEEIEPIYDYEFVFLQDGSDPNMIQMLSEWCIGDKKEQIRWQMHDLKDDFGTHKNILNSYCTGDYIFQIDADEYPSAILVACLGSLFFQNPNIDLMWVPRINTVDGLTPEHIKKWGWRVERLKDADMDVINFPDYQSRIYRNDPKIKWVNKVHEHIEGANKFTKLPAEMIWALFHPKTIQKQEQQNAKYMMMER